MPKLENPKHEKFCKELLKNKFNQKRAYMASYPDSSEDSALSNASRLMGNDNVQRRLSELSTKQDEKDLITVDEIINDLKELKERCLQKEAVMEFDHSEKKMVETGEWKFDSSGAAKALDMLGKYKGIWQNKSEVTIKEKSIEEILQEMK